MSAKLDKSLDEILSGSRRTSGRGRGRAGRRSTGKPAVVAPSGGIQKNTRGAKNAVKHIPTGPSGGSGESKIQVSNLPKDVNEPMIKEYFVKAVGPVKKVDISYGPGGVSRGVATITFVRSDSATKAASSLQGLLVDSKAMKIDVIIDAKAVSLLPPPKGLGDRITQPKSQPKSAATVKASTATRGKGAARGRGRGGKSGRPAKKTAEELDTEMNDYFGGAKTETDNTAAAPAANGDANMDDGIL